MLKIFAVYDQTKQKYGSVHLDVNEGVAVRSFGQQCTQTFANDQINMFKEFPDDFHLVVLGTFNPDTGEIRSEKKPRIIASANQYVPKEKKE